MSNEVLSLMTGITALAIALVIFEIVGAVKVVLGKFKQQGKEK